MRKGLSVTFQSINMKCIFRYVTMLLLVCIFFSVSTSAQKKISKYEIGAGLGAFVYQGDLTPWAMGAVNTMRPGFFIQGTRKFNPNFALRLNLTRASLHGDDAKYSSPAYRQQRNFNFHSRLTEISPQLMYTPSGWDNDIGKRITPYAFGGVAITFLKVKRDWSNFNASHFQSTDLLARIAEDMAHRTPRVTAAVPVGAGLRYAISSNLVLNAELSYRILFTDYLDGFSKAANPSRKDHYYNIGVGLIYRFGRKNSWGCPPVRQ